MKAGADLAARVISTPGAPLALSQAALQRGDVRGAELAAAVLAAAAKAGPELASAIATPDVLAALVLGSGRAGSNCIGVLCNLARVSPHLALRVADAPGAEAALLSALTCTDSLVASTAARTLWNILDADAQRIARLLSVPDVPPAIARLLQSNDATDVEAGTGEGLNLFVCFCLNIWYELALMQNLHQQQGSRIRALVLSDRPPPPLKIKPSPIYDNPLTPPSSQPAQFSWHAWRNVE